MKRPFNKLASGIDFLVIHILFTFILKLFNFFSLADKTYIG